MALVGQKGGRLISEASANTSNCCVEFAFLLLVAAGGKVGQLNISSRVEAESSPRCSQYYEVNRPFCFACQSQLTALLLFYLFKYVLFLLSIVCRDCGLLYIEMYKQM